MGREYKRQQRMMLERVYDALPASLETWDAREAQRKAEQDAGAGKADAEAAAEAEAREESAEAMEEGN